MFPLNDVQRELSVLNCPLSAVVRIRSTIAIVLCFVGTAHSLTLSQERKPAKLDSVRVSSMVVLDLQTVISRALAASPVVTQSEQGIVSAQSADRVAVGAYLPTLTASALSLRSDILSSYGARAN